MCRITMASRTSLAGLVVIFLGLLIVIVQALNMNNLFSVENMLRSLGLILIGVAVQLAGLGLMLLNKK